jgi:hypothetical protein
MLAFSRTYSNDPNTHSFSRTIGPPRLKTKFCRPKGCLGAGSGLSSTLRALSAVSRKYNAPRPCHTSVPRLVLRMTEPPLVREVSASNCAVRTTNWSSASGE